jgi:hypothetical protein
MEKINKEEKLKRKSNPNLKMDLLNLKKEKIKMIQKLLHKRMVVEEKEKEVYLNQVIMINLQEKVVKHKILQLMIKKLEEEKVGRRMANNQILVVDK